MHLADEDGAHRGENDMRCTMEARIEGYHPLAVTAHADSLHRSVVSAADKLARVIESTLDRLHDHKTSPRRAEARLTKRQWRNEKANCGSQQHDGENPLPDLGRPGLPTAQQQSRRCCAGPATTVPRLRGQYQQGME